MLRPSTYRDIDRIEQKPPGAPTIYFVEMPEPRAKGLEKRHSRAVAQACDFCVRWARDRSGFNKRGRGCV